MHPPDLEDIVQKLAELTPHQQEHIMNYSGLSAIAYQQSIHGLTARFGMKETLCPSLK